MPDVKLKVSADTTGVGAAVDSVTQKAEAAGKKLGRGPKLNPIDLKSFEDGLRKQEELFSKHLKKLQDLAKRNPVAMPGAGGAPAPAAGGAGGLPPLPPPPAPLAPRGPSRPRGRHAYTHSPDISDVGRNLISGFGGGAGMISQYATRGAVAGANGGGGFLGGGLGLLKGLGIGALAFGALKAGQMGSEGMDLAKERLGALDRLKRQLGDLGVSFNALKVVSEAAAEGMGINSKEAAELAVNFNRLSRGSERTAEGLSDAVRTGVGLSKAYGLDPSAGVGFLGNMRNIDPRQNNRELALVLADTIARSGMNAKADEVMQAITSFASTTARMSLSTPNVGAFGSAYGSLMSAGYAGMTGDVAASILGTANSSMMRMGAMGEAGQNFTYAAFKNAGGAGLNPFTAQALASGGIFGTRASVFGDNTPMARLFGRKGVDIGQLAGGAGANTTNLEAVVAQLERSGASIGIKNDSLKNYFGLSSPQQAAALYNMVLDSQGKAGGGTIGLLQRAGVDPSKVNERGIAALGRIGAAGSVADLEGIYATMAKRTGKGALTDEDKKLHDAAGTDFNKLQDALLKIASGKDMEETDFSKMTDAIKTVESAQIKVGDLLLKPLNAIRDGMLAMAGASSPAALREKVLEIGRSEIRAAHEKDYEKAAADIHYGAWQGKHGDLKGLRKATDDKIAADIAKYEGEYAAGDVGLGVAPAQADTGGAAGVAPGSGGSSAPAGDRRARIAAIEKKYGLPAGLLLGQWGTESSFGKNIGMSSAGAMGHFQFMPGTASQYGVRIGDFDSELDGAARYMSDLHRQKGSWKGAAFAYNGVVHNFAAGEDYWRKVQANGGFHLDDGVTPMPGGAARGGAGGSHGKLDVSVTVKQQTPDGRGGMQERVVGTTKVAMPRGAGAVAVEAH
jgi:hypothetical protein